MLSAIRYPLSANKMFIDKIEIEVEAGRGGNGVNSFYRDKFVRPGRKGRGRPDGGDGGNGGDVILKASSRMHTLLDFYYKKNFSGEKGSHGQGNGRRGRNGSDCLIEVPCGTVVKDLKFDCILKDLKHASDTVIVAKGGLGGRGNKRAENATEGKSGERRRLLLELKFIADVGIIGLPNAGKSSLLSVISKARPKIAPYPFTTKSPVLGIVKCGDFSFVVAEIPGIIRDAHAGKGLGFEFLRHVERTKILIHLIDMSAASSDEPVNAYQTLNQELKLYKNKIIGKPQIIVANKMDLNGSEQNLIKFKEQLDVDVISISAQKRHNLDRLLDAIRRNLQKNCS